MAFGNLSISRVDGASPVRPRIAERSAEGVRPDKAKEGRSKQTESSSGTRGAERTKLRTRQSEEGSLTLTTAEGDKVTISFSNKQSTKVDQAKLYGPDGSYEKTRVQSRETAQLYSVDLAAPMNEESVRRVLNKAPRER